MNTLEEFIKACCQHPALRYRVFSGWVRLAGFKPAYVRYSTSFYRASEELPCIPTITLASLEAENPGSGAFSSLLDYLTEVYSDCAIVVECVLNKRFEKFLLRRGFVYYGNCQLGARTLMRRGSGGDVVNAD